MLKQFSTATKYFHLKNKAVSIDNAAFKCHYRITFLILLVATILVTSRCVCVFKLNIFDKFYFFLNIVDNTLVNT